MAEGIRLTFGCANKHCASRVFVVALVKSVEQVNEDDISSCFTKKKKCKNYANGHDVQWRQGQAHVRTFVLGASRDHVISG